MEKQVIRDDASLWFENQRAEIQDFEIPEAETPPFLNPDDNSFHDDDFQEDQEKREHITNKDVNTQLNALRLNEPTSEIIVALMDVLLPIVLLLVFKNTDKQSLKLDDGERETLINAWSKFLGEKSINLSPGWLLISSILTIYGAKVLVAVTEKKQKDDELQLLRDQNEYLRDVIAISKTLPKNDTA